MATASHDFIVVSTTLPNENDAQRLAQHLVEQQLAACVHVIGPLASVYRWQGAVESAQEWTCQAKVRASRFDKVSQVISEHHPYDVPEIIATPLVATTAAYGKWLDENC